VKAFGERLRARRKELGKTIAECASAFGMSQPAWTFWEQGSREPKLDALIAVSSYLETTPDILLGCSATSPQVSVNGDGNTIANSPNSKISVVAPPTNCKTCQYKAAVKKLQKAGLQIPGL